MRRLAALLFAMIPLTATSDTAGEFDYYVMSLSWSPNWCALEGDARNSDQCDARHDYGWILHGLWPQNEKGYPTSCTSAKRPPSRQMTGDMADIMGNAGLAWHQWKKHGVCSGLSATDYFDLSREAYSTVQRPLVFRSLTDPVRIAPSVIEEAFIQSNPTLEPDQITITCRDGHIQEARICLTKGLSFRRCGADALKDCSARSALFTPLR